jgi:predicted HTH transcriptional regulator
MEEETTQTTTQITTQKASDLILSLISKDGTFTRKQLTDKICLTEDEVKWNLNQLCRNAVIRRVGPLIMEVIGNYRKEN